MNVLLVEDDNVLGRAVQKGLMEVGHTCRWSHNGDEGLRAAQAEKFDVVVLDLMLPDLPGTDLLRQLRSAGIRTPVLILTAMGSVDDRVNGLNAGADDYLVKPFAFAELTARLQAICRRASPEPTREFDVGPLRFDLATRRITREGKEIELTPTEFRLIEFLARHKGQVVTRKMLCEHLWDSNWEGVTNVIEVHVNRLRSKVDRGFDRPLIQTVRGRGYVLEAT